MSLRYVCIALVVWVGAFVLCVPVAVAQNTSAIPATHTAPENRDNANNPATSTQVGVPVAAGASLGGENQKGVTPTLGFQLWKRDKFFVGTFFSIATTDGTVSDKVGSFVLNPPLQGNSFYVTGDYLFDLKDLPILIGIGGRWGTTSASFQYTPAGGTATTKSGFASYAAVTAQIYSKTFDVALGSSGETGEFQLGLELGPTLRVLGGDLGESDAIRQQLLGATDSRFTGFEYTFFARINSIQPFARFSHFGRPGNVAISGFTGNQVVWGLNVAGSLFQTSVK